MPAAEYTEVELGGGRNDRTSRASQGVLRDNLTDV